MFSLVHFPAEGPQVVDKSASNIMTTLLNMMRYEDHVTAKTIRNVIKEHLPEAVPVDAALIANVRARAILHMKQMKTDENGKILHHTTIIVECAEGKMCGLEINNPKFIGIASQQLRSILVDALKKGKELDQIINIL